MTAGLSDPEWRDEEMFSILGSSGCILCSHTFLCTWWHGHTGLYSHRILFKKWGLLGTSGINWIVWGKSVFISRQAGKKWLLHGAMMSFLHLNLQRHSGKFTQLLLDRGAIGVWAAGWSRAMGEDQMGISVQNIVVASVVSWPCFSR